MLGPVPFSHENFLLYAIHVIFILCCWYFLGCLLCLAGPGRIWSIKCWIWSTHCPPPPHGNSPPAHARDTPVQVHCKDQGWGHKRGLHLGLRGVAGGGGGSSSTTLVLGHGVFLKGRNSRLVVLATSLPVHIFSEHITYEQPAENQIPLCGGNTAYM